MLGHLNLTSNVHLYMLDGNKKQRAPPILHRTSAELASCRTYEVQNSSDQVILSCVQLQYNVSMKGEGLTLALFFLDTGCGQVGGVQCEPLQPVALKTKG